MTLTVEQVMQRSIEVAVFQGEFRTSADPQVVLTTLLGSCVATCLFDPVARVGGMNHFLLPTAPTGRTPSERYGLYAMEVLINELMKFGAQKLSMQAKLFGGAMMETGTSDIGAANARFARSFLIREDIPCVTSSLGGQQGRRLQFTPTTGAVRQRLMKAPPPFRPNTPAPVDEIHFFED